MFVWTWHREILRHHSSWCVLSQQPIPFLYVSEHAQCMPSYAPPAGPPRSLVLSAWPAQQWLSIDQLQNMHTLIYTQTHTSSRCVPLGALPSLFPGIFFSFHPPRFFFWYEDLQMCADSCFLYFYLNWGPKENKKRLTEFGISFALSRTSNLKLTLCCCIIVFAKTAFCRWQQKRASSDSWKQKTLLQNVNQHSCILSFLLFFISQLLFIYKTDIRLCEAPTPPPWLLSLCLSCPLLKSGMGLLHHGYHMQPKQTADNKKDEPHPSNLIHL